MAPESLGVQRASKSVPTGQTTVERSRGDRVAREGRQRASRHCVAWGLGVSKV